MGVAGSGMSAVFELAKALGNDVTGCDENTGGHSASHLACGVELLCVSPSVFYLNEHCEELFEARKNHIPIITWQELMGKNLFRKHLTVAVCGTHGKTTTTALAGFLLETAGFDPWVEVGGIVINWQKNYRLGNSKYFVCEADEFYDNFLNIAADIIIVNNIELDHPEYFGTREKMFESYVKFLNAAKPQASVIANTANLGIKDFLEFYCQSKKYRSDLNFVLYDDDFCKENENILAQLNIFGEQNKNNALSIIKLAEILAIKPVVGQAFANFLGVKRRQEELTKGTGEFAVRVFDDYAHHPTAIEKTLLAFRQKFPEKMLVAVIQPHTYSRLEKLFSDFKKCSLIADLTIYVEVFASRERGLGKISSADLVKAVGKPNVIWASSFSKAQEILSSRVHNGIVVFMGAGDITDLSQSYLKCLKS